MIETPKRYTVTAALIYANGPIHIGHLAGCYLPADIYVRYLRSTGADVVFISGTDEHGVPITIKAKKEETTPQAVVDKYYKIISDSFEQFGISFDIYSRTSNKAHHKMSQDFFTTLYKKKSFTEETTEQYFDVKANQFLADRYIMGTCPNCGNENAYGDQCEKCGSTLSPEELINPRSTLSGDKPEKKATKNWYLPLDKLQGKLENYVNSHSEWKSNVFGQCQSWLKQGLHPRAMTRDLDWGVKVPVEGTDGKVLYVWFDAPIGYITFTEELFQQSFEERKNKLTKAHALNYPNSATHKPESWNLYWRKAQEKETKLVHFIGKDNIVFHCLIFPAMVMEHGDFLLADNVPANEFMNLENDKISTSRNWAVWLHEYLQEFPGKQDILRYTLCATAPETKDSDFTWADFQARNNNELVAIFGNFVNRAVVLTHKFYEGKIPAAGKLEAIDEQVIKELSNYKDLIKGSLENYRFREAQAYMIDLARVGNKYLADTEPWKLIKTDEVRTATILNLSLQIAANLTIVAEPFLPFTAEKLVRMLKLPRLQWADAGRADLLKAGDSIAAAELLFEKIEDETIQKQVQKLLDTKKANEMAAATVTPAKEAVSFDDFAKMDIRVATILTAEKVAKTKKLLKLTLDTGIDTRTVVSGIAEHYEPEKIIGQQVVMLANLAPREIKGIESKGMILMAEDKDGKLRFVTPSEAVSNGSTVA